MAFYFTLKAFYFTLKVSPGARAGTAAELDQGGLIFSCGYQNLQK
jgi:hypothetical protein